MRIVGGEYRGRTLNEFNGYDIRPTSDKVRESLFNILQNRIYGARFLDLFCGTGAMGLEALSRGASRVVFNDFAIKSLNLAKSNAQKIKAEGDTCFVNKSANVFIETCLEKFDIVYIDPPYNSGLGEQALENVKDLLDDNGLIILEEEKPFNATVNGLEKVDARKYGRAHLTFFKKSNVIEVEK